MSEIIPLQNQDQFEYIHDGVTFFINITNESQKDEINTTLFQPSTLKLMDLESYIVTDEEGLEHGYIIPFEGEGYQYVSKFGTEETNEGTLSIINTLNEKFNIEVSKTKAKIQIRATFQEEFDSIYT